MSFGRCASGTACEHEMLSDAGGSTNKVKIWSADTSETAAEVAALALPAVRPLLPRLVELMQRITSSETDVSSLLVRQCGYGPLTDQLIWDMLAGASSGGGPRAQGEENFKKERFVLSVAYSPDGKRLACGSMDGSVAIFDVVSGKLLHTLDGHFKPVRSLTFTPGGRRIPAAFS